MKKQKILIVIGVISVFSYPCTAFGSAVANNSSELVTTIIGDDRIVKPAFGEDEWDKENQGTGSKGMLTIDRVPSFIWLDTPSQPLKGETTITSGPVLNKNSYLQVTDLRGTHSGYRITVSFNKDEQWMYEDNVEINPANMTFSLQQGKEGTANFLKPGPGFEKVKAPQMKEAVLKLDEESVVIDASVGEGIGTWGMWWRSSNILMDQNIPRYNKTLKSKAIVWSLLDGPY